LPLLPRFFPTKSELAPAPLFLLYLTSASGLGFGLISLWLIGFMAIIC